MWNWIHASKNCKIWTLNIILQWWELWINSGGKQLYKRKDNGLKQSHTLPGFCLNNWMKLSVVEVGRMQVCAFSQESSQVSLTFSPAVNCHRVLRGGDFRWESTGPFCGGDSGLPWKETALQLHRLTLCLLSTLTPVHSLHSTQPGWYPVIFFKFGFRLFLKFTTGQQCTISILSSKAKWEAFGSPLGRCSGWWGLGWAQSGCSKRWALPQPISEASSVPRGSNWILGPYLVLKHNLGGLYLIQVVFYPY